MGAPEFRFGGKLPRVVWEGNRCAAWEAKWYTYCNHTLQQQLDGIPSWFAIAPDLGCAVQ
jgi:hypothetical protein